MSARRRVLITGASAGIGAELARVFAENGHDLVLVARRAEKLRELAGALASTGADVVTMAQDLGEVDAGARLVAALDARNLAIDVLANNAGIAYGGSFAKMSPTTAHDLVQLNVIALVDLTQRLLPGMLARGFGRILNVASLSAFQPVPMMSLYAASKAFVLSFSEGLSEELKGTGVSVTALCPGFTDTAMVADATGAHAGLPEIPKPFLADAREVAIEGYRACMNGEAVRVPGIANQLSALWSTTTPRWLVRTMGGFFARTMMKE
jgi:hypothetical protein